MSAPIAFRSLISKRNFESEPRDQSKHPSETLVLHNEDGNRARSRDTQTSSTLVIASGRNLGDEEELGEGCMSPKQGEDDFDMILMRHYPVT
ncbi:hypothetical protein Tco_1243496 [Tanacetum coccineum]